ncbi:MAG: SusD/RagB family nutrient-binding outer membrane lipoprotein [Puia sp.]|nr:SusD/RagB family nutrient-binding outer membrane lipoprotein [Puia sp.]
MYTVLNFKYRYAFFGFLLIAFFSCSRSKFAQLNTDPDAVLTIDPSTELTPGELSIHSSDFEVFYDFVRDIKPWTQTYVRTVGNLATFTTSGGNINNRWGIFYGGVGYNLADVLHIIDNMPAAKNAQYQYMRAIATIPMIYYAFYVSDANGSIPYTEAFKARYTVPPLFTPHYQAQEILYDTLDAQLKAAVAVLESSPSVTQISPGAQDIYFGGDPTHWIKAANSLRLKIAMRLMKQNPAKTTAIANEVINEQVGLIGSIADDWILYSSTLGNGGNSNPINQGNYSGEYNHVNFMWKTQDPRIRVFYQQSGINTQDIFDSAKAQGALPDTLLWDGQPYRGQFASPAVNEDPTRAYYFQTITFSYKGVKQQLSYPSIIQAGLTSYVLNLPSGTGGKNMFPVITYADVCLMRAELAARNLTSDPIPAATLYDSGVVASLKNYDTWASNTGELNYTPLLASEISNYLAQPGVAYDPVNAIEQICDQEYLNYYVNANEGWALIKRTGYPSSTGVIMPSEDVSAYPAMPRRYAATFPSLGDLNYTNEVNAIDSMALDKNYGAPTDMTGRVWWDSPNP